MTLEERLLYIAEDPFGLCDKNSLRKIALEVRKIEDRIKQLETENDATNAEIRSFQYNIDRVMGMYASKDNQICNLLNICRANGIDVSSQDLIHGKESK